MMKLLLTLCQYDCVICASDVCDILSIDVYSLSILQCFSYQLFRDMLNRRGDNIQPCRTPCFIVISSDVSFSYRTVAFCCRPIGKYVWLRLIICLVFRLSTGFRKVCHAKCLGVINETNVNCFFFTISQ